MPSSNSNKIEKSQNTKNFTKKLIIVILGIILVGIVTELYITNRLNFLQFALTEQTFPDSQYDFIYYSVDESEGGYYRYVSRNDENIKLSNSELQSLSLIKDYTSPDGFTFQQESEYDFKISPGSDKIGVQYLIKNNQKRKLRLKTFDNHYKHVQFYGWVKS